MIYISLKVFAGEAGCLLGMISVVPRSLKLSAAVTTWLAAVLSVLCAVVPGLAATSAAGPGPSPAARACGALPKFREAVAAQIMTGKLAIAPFKTVTVDPHRDGDIDWSLNPFGNPTWQQDFRSAGWAGQLIAGWITGGPEAKAYRQRAGRIARGWLRAIPPGGRDPHTLVCIAQAFPGQAWIQQQIGPTVSYYAAHWPGPWNHGLAQDIKLLRIGCGYPASAFGGAALSWRRTAVSQMSSMFEPNYLGPAIDAQGAVNEQATGYANFVYDLWRDALPMVRACGYRLPPWITQRIAKLPVFLACATQPDGNLVQAGDTYVERPAVAPKQPGLVAVYRGGYVFGRSSWSKTASFYSLRFGRGQQVHGHSDHMGLTYFARGRNLIVDAGHAGYEVSDYRTWLRAPEAASMLVMPGVPFSAASATSLVADRIGKTSQFYEFYDHAFGGHPRYRSVLVDQRPDFVLVFDRAAGAPSYQQLWHLDPSLEITALTRSSVIASARATKTAPAVKLELKQVPLPGQTVPRGSTKVVRAQVNPYQGWVSHQMLQRIPDDVAEMTRTGGSAQMLTLIAAAAPGTAIRAALSGPAGGPYRLQVRIGTQLSRLMVTAGGTIR